MQIYTNNNIYIYIHIYIYIYIYIYFNKFIGYYEAENPNYLEIAQEIKKDGNNKFCTSNYKSAVKAYKKVMFINNITIIK